MSRQIYDISQPLSAATPTWPGDPPVEIRYLADLAAGDGYALSALSMSSHAGTHVDAPSHYVAGGADVGDLDLDLFVGPAWVADAAPPTSGRGPAPIDAEALASLDLPEGTERLLLRTRNPGPSRSPHRPAVPEWGLDQSGAAWLLEHGVRLVGIDCPSIAAGEELAAVHRQLLSAGVIVLEGLELAGVPPGLYELLCLPLAVVGAEAAPARAVLLGPDAPARAAPLNQGSRFG